jgi:hypothetical protein
MIIQKKILTLFDPINQPSYTYMQYHSIEMAEINNLSKRWTVCRDKRLLVSLQELRKSWK